MPGPAGQVGGAGQDIEEVPLGQPVQDRRLQREDGPPPLGALVPGQYRLAALQAQVGVRRVPLVDVGRSLGQQRPVVRHQGLGIGRDGGLLAELCDVRCSSRSASSRARPFL